MFSSSLVSESFSSLPPDDRFFRNNFVTKSKCQNVLICWKPGRQRCGPIFDYQYIDKLRQISFRLTIYINALSFPSKNALQETPMYNVSEIFKDIKSAYMISKKPTWATPHPSRFEWLQNTPYEIQMVQRFSFLCNWNKLSMKMKSGRVSNLRYSKSFLNFF